MFKQAAALGLKKQIITTGGSQNPDQLIDQAGTAVNGTMHLTTFAPWVPEVVAGSGSHQRVSSREWKKRGFQFAGVTESFRGYDGIRTIAAAIAKGGKSRAGGNSRSLVADSRSPALTARSSSTKSGPAGKESGQSIPTVYLIKIDNGKVVIPQG